MKPLCISCNLCTAKCHVVNPLGMRACDLNDFASDSTIWSAGGAIGSDSSCEVFLHFDDCLAFGCLLRFLDLVVVVGFESDATLFDFVSKVDFHFPFATGAMGCGSGAENLE